MSWLQALLLQVETNSQVRGENIEHRREGELLNNRQYTYTMEGFYPLFYSPPPPPPSFRVDMCKRTTCFPPMTHQTVLLQFCCLCSCFTVVFVVVVCGGGGSVHMHTPNGRLIFVLPIPFIRLLVSLEL